MRESLEENLNIGWKSQQWEDNKGEEVWRVVYMEPQLEAHC
jgi:hypothetical protein